MDPKKRTPLQYMSTLSSNCNAPLNKHEHFTKYLYLMLQIVMHHWTNHGYFHKIFIPGCKKIAQLLMCFTNSGASFYIALMHGKNMHSELRPLATEICFLTQYKFVHLQNDKTLYNSK